MHDWLRTDCEFAWRPVVKSSVRTTLIIVPSPSFDELLYFGECFELVHVETFISKNSVERFDKRVISRLSRSGEIDLGPVLIRAQVQRLATNIASVVAK